MATRILFLCTGNTCRSPVAEAVARQLFGQLALTFVSAGLDTFGGQPASDESMEFVFRSGASLENHRSQTVTEDLLEDTAWVIGMTRSHAALFRSRFAESYTGSIGVLGAAGSDLRLVKHSPDVEEVADPYGGPPDKYDVVCGQIRRLLADWEPAFRETAEPKETET